MKRALLLFSVSVICCIACAQNLQTVIKTQAMDMSTALIKNDFTSFVKYMHPKLVEFSGGLGRLKNKMDYRYVFAPILCFILNSVFWLLYSLF